MKQDIAPMILLVEDDHERRVSLAKIINNSKYQLIQSANIADAEKAISEYGEKIALLIVHEVIAKQSCVNLLQWFARENNLAGLPSIIYTEKEQFIDENRLWKAGAFACLKSPLRQDTMLAMIDAAIRVSEKERNLNIELASHKSVFKMIDQIAVKIKNLSEAEDAARFIANSFPDSNIILPAIAELVTNAVEHGLFGVSYEDKTRLVENGQWRDELSKLAELPQHQGKSVELIFKKEFKGGKEKYFIKITDPGKGFAWHKYLSSDPARGLDNHGRGIARAAMSFSEIKYNQVGNEVLAVLDQSDVKTIEW